MSNATMSVKTTTAANSPEDAQEAILAKAREMDAHRKIRAIYRLSEWRASQQNNGRTIIHISDIDPLTNEAKTYTDNSNSRNGFDCSCDDCHNVRQMRRQIAALLCGTPLSCYHVPTRTLLQGGIVMVFCPKTLVHLATAQMGPDGVHAYIRIEPGMNARWEALVWEATKCWGDKAIVPAGQARAQGRRGKAMVA